MACVLHRQGTRSDSARDASFVRLSSPHCCTFFRHRPLRTLLALFLFASGCTVTTWDGQVLPSRDSETSIGGYLDKPGRCVRIEAKRVGEERWETLGTATSSMTRATSLYGRDWYGWKLPEAVSVQRPNCV